MREGVKQMTNIVKFPRQEAVEEAPKVEDPVRKLDGAGIGATVFKGVWVVTVLVWPILKWVIALDCVYQLVRMLYHWNTPGVYAGWTFVFHFAVLTALTYFVSVYKPKGL
jgi:hypothetical protein